MVWVLGVESSCDETAASVVSDQGDVASDVVHSQVAIHAQYGGVVPEVASRDHLRAIIPVVSEALQRANRTLADVDAIAVTNRPGLLGALLVGVQVAKGLAYSANLPLIGVDHLVGHLLAPWLRRPAPAEAPLPAETVKPPLSYPYVALLASGGHTSIYRVNGPLASMIQELGGTRDDAAGEAFDKVGKLLGLGYPGGPIVDRRSTRGRTDAHRLVRPMAHRGLEMSFSGLKTQIATLVDKRGANPDPMTDAEVDDICACFQAAATSVMVDKLIAAAQQEHVDSIVLAGGVAANRELRVRATHAAQRFGLQLTIPPFASCTDNAAMIAYAGAQRLVHGETDRFDLAPMSNTSLATRTHRGAGPRSTNLRK